MSMFVAIKDDEEMFIYLRQLVKRNSQRKSKRWERKKQGYLFCMWKQAILACRHMGDE